MDRVRLIRCGIKTAHWLCAAAFALVLLTVASATAPPVRPLSALAATGIIAAADLLLTLPLYWARRQA